MVDPLDELLGSYKLAPLDAGLADRIVAEARAQSYRRRQPWLAQAAMMAGVAVLGFWLGGSHPQTTVTAATTADSSPSYLEKTIFGAHTIDEVLL